MSPGGSVLTDLGNWVMPFVNYDIGDRAPARHAAACGRGFPTTEMVEDRLSETIRTPGQIDQQQRPRLA